MVDSWGSNSEYEEKYNLVEDNSILWSNDYFKKINKILTCEVFDLYLDYDTFIKKYDIEDLLSNFLINNIKYYNNYFSIHLDQAEISMYSICLANIPIDEQFKQKLVIYLQHEWSYNNILLIFLNIIDNNNLDLFKIVYAKYPEIIDDKIITYSKIKYNIVNHSLLCSNSIFEYICKDINIFKYIKPHIDLNLYIDDSYDFLNTIGNNIVNFNYNFKTHKWNYNPTKKGYIYSLTTFMTKCIGEKHINYSNNNTNYPTNNTNYPTNNTNYSNNNTNYSNNNTYYNKLIEIFILKINDFEVINEYLELCIKNINYNLIHNYLNKRIKILKKINLNSLLHLLVNMFDRANSYNNSVQNDIIKIWNLIFPYIEKYSLDYISDYFVDNSINNIVAFKKSVDIIIQLEPYISNWNKEDFCHYTPILDAIRYSKFETVYYMIMNYDINLKVESLDYHNILSCALMNNDLRVIDYIYKLILNDVSLRNMIHLNINNCVSILQNYDLDSFKKYKKKFDIFISLGGVSYIPLILEKTIKYKPLVKHVIKKYNYKLQFKKINENYEKILNCSNLNKEYLKLVIDNIDYDKSDYKVIIDYICTIGCTDLIIEIFKYMLSKINFNKIDISGCYFDNLFLKVYDNIKNNNCNKCKDFDNKTQFIKYIDFMKKNIIKNDTSVFYIINYYSNLSDYDDICDVLFQNGIYFIKYSNEYNIDNTKINNINSMYFIKLINLKRSAGWAISYTTKDYSLTFLNWAIVICKLKMFVRKRFNKCKQSFIHKLTNINDEINFSTSFKNSFKHNIPTHLTPLDCYKPLNETHKYISIKADGVYKKGVFDVYPKLNSCEDLEYEFIKDENMCYIFDSYDVIINLRNKHSYISNKIYPYLNLDNYKDVLLEYNELEKSAIKQFIQSNEYKKKWWAKYVFKIDEMSHLDYLKLLHGISELMLDCISNDGWILNGDNSIYKIKPRKLLTLDLLCKSNKLYDKQHNIYDHSSNKLINNKIYRCYYDNEWVPREIRYDKFIPNDDTICKFIVKSHKLLWWIKDIKLINSYYQKHYNKNKCNYNLSINLNNKSVLDLGCGYSNKYVGIDIDPKVLNHKKKGEIYICDLTKKWDLEAQIKEYKNIYYYLPNITDFTNKYNNYNFEVILSINSIHYLLNSNNDILFYNINKYTKKNSLFIIKFLDKDLLDMLLKKNKYISNGSSFVRSYDESKIKIYYDWVHTKPMIETLYSKNDLETIFNKYGWKLKEYNKMELNNTMSDWDNYFKCFSTLIFLRT